MDINELYDKALRIAIRAHEGQKDRSGKEYIMHPIRVSERCVTMQAKIVALLHDTIEDTDITPDDLLSEGFPQTIVDGVLSVTRREDETYEEFVRRSEQNAIGKEVKLADLEDNMDIRRLNDITEEDVQRLRKYHKAWRYLQKNK